ncbi:MAG: hypothetical protein R3345_14300 [Fulvivirga sp.]|nr:hypothetical protein [Fulvivirga sp.]
MKKLTYLLSAGFLVVLLAAVGCGNDDGGNLSPQDAAGVNFEDTWVVGTSGSVFFESEDRTADYSNFTLTTVYTAGQGEGTYTTTGGPTGASPWPSSGVWSFNSNEPDANAFQVTRDDGLVIDVVITGDTMTLNFLFNDASHKTDQEGRIEAVDGNWTFTLSRQQ